MKPVVQLSIVIAVQNAQENLPDILSHLDPARHPDVEFLFCSTSADPDTQRQTAGHENVHVLSRPADSLIPHLWREGILACHADKVALTTAHCIPDNDWVDHLKCISLTTNPATGGVIYNDDASDAKSWAIYLLRYISYSPQPTKMQVAEIAADNAVYDRKHVLQHTDLLEKGFWEPSFHRRFRQAGMMLTLNPELRVIHRNQYTVGQFFKQRLAHGKTFGLDRAGDIFNTKKMVTHCAFAVVAFLVFNKNYCSRDKKWSIHSKAAGFVSLVIVVFIRMGTR